MPPPASEGRSPNFRFQPAAGPGAKRHSLQDRQPPRPQPRKSGIRDSGSEIQSARQDPVPRRRTSALPERGCLSSGALKGHSGAGPQRTGGKRRGWGGVELTRKSAGAQSSSQSRRSRMIPVTRPLSAAGRPGLARSGNQMVSSNSRCPGWWQR